MSGKWDITDGDKPGEGDVVGFAQALPSTGLIYVKIDGYLTPAALQFARIQMMAAINAVENPGSQP